MSLSRRQFVNLSLGVSLGTSVLSEVAAAQRTLAINSNPWWTLYDPRFAGTVQAAAQLHAHAPLYAIKGDLTELIAPFMQQLQISRPLVMHGITTETIPFGLQQLARHHGRVGIRSSRFDRDLFVWQLHITQDIRS